MNVRIIGGVVLVCAIVVVAGVLLYNYEFNPGLTDNYNNENKTNNGTTNPSINQSALTLLPDSQIGFTPNPLPGPSPSPGPGPIPSPSPGPGPTPTTTPGYAKIVEMFDEYLQSIFPQSNIPGLAVAIVHNGEVIYINTLGVRNVTSGELVTPDTLFEIGSLTKAFTATNIAQLVDNGMLHWNDTLKDKFPFQLYDDRDEKLTISDALSHASGLPTYSGNTNWLIFNETYNSILSKFPNVTPDAPFPTYEYNNIIYCLPPFYAQSINGITWNEQITQMLLRPLDMNTATTNYTDFLNSPNHAASYKYTSTGDLVEWHGANLDTVGPSGSMGASLNEMINWLNFQLADTGYYNGVRIVSKENLDATKTGHIYMDSTSRYGYGWIISTKGYISHAGSTVASESLLTLFPSKGIGIVILNNQNPLGLAMNTALITKFIDLLNGNNSTDPWPSFRDANYIPDYGPKNPTPPLPFGNYTGVYNNAFYGNIKIIEDNNKLICYYGNNSNPYTLRHYNDSIFKDDLGLGYIEFTNITDGKAEKAWIYIRDYSEPPDLPSEFNRTNNT